MINIAILGYGTVGSGVYEICVGNADGLEQKSGNKINVKRILDLRDFPDHPHQELFTKNYDDILNDKEISVVVEVMGGVEPAYRFTKAALLSGKSVVTSNKELVATHGTELLKIAAEKDVNYLFEASVGGGIPIIRPLNSCLAANRINEIFGILNGTTNYILTEMISKGTSFADALADAQKKGYAERNPEADIEGHDACRKICILASLAFGQEIKADSILCEGITNISLDDVTYAGKLGHVIKLIGYTKKEDDKVYCRVSPMLVPHENPLSGVEGVFNAIMVRGDVVGDVMFYGRGAGKLPTASAVVADVIDIVKGSGNKNFLWTKPENDINGNIADINIRMFVRAGNASADDIKAVFPNAIITDDGKAFITGIEKEDTINKKLEKFNVISKIRAMAE